LAANIAMEAFLDWNFHKTILANIKAFLRAGKAYFGKENVKKKVNEFFHRYLRDD